ncbi:uncharacterized protein LOC135486568 [Lineus longissimus]|uniref:uncharacterized protein LOC135486568 n=1 Tax=Lineus longissimus TaxID=88925 RepID=UPI002B4F81E5
MTDIIRMQDSSPPPSPTKRRHGTVLAPHTCIFTQPEITQTLPQFVFSSPEPTRKSYHGSGEAPVNGSRDGGVPPNEVTIQGTSNGPSQGRATLSGTSANKPCDGHVAVTHPENRPKDSSPGISPFYGPHEGKCAWTQPVNGSNATQIIVTPPTPTGFSAGDRIDLPERFKQTCFKKSAIREEIDSVTELRERERDLTTAIGWIRQEILKMKQADRDLMRKFMELGTVIHTLRDSGTFNVTSSFDSLDELLLLEEFREVGAYMPIDETLPNLAFKLRTMSTIVEPTVEHLTLPVPRRKDSAFL